MAIQQCLVYGRITLSPALTPTPRDTADLIKSSPSLLASVLIVPPIYTAMCCGGRDLLQSIVPPFIISLLRSTYPPSQTIQATDHEHKIEDAQFDEGTHARGRSNRTCCAERTYGGSLADQSSCSPQETRTEERGGICSRSCRMALVSYKAPTLGRDQQLTVFRYVKKYGPSDPRDMRVMKHFAETMALGTIGKLDGEDELPTPDSLRIKMRRFYNAWERHYKLEISLDVKRSMAPVRINPNGRRYLGYEAILTGTNSIFKAS